METPELPDACADGDHDFDQGGRCRNCGIDRADQYPRPKKTGGAGATLHATTDRQYREQIRKLERTGALE